MGYIFYKGLVGFTGAMLVAFAFVASVTLLAVIAVLYVVCAAIVAVTNLFSRSAN